MNSLKKMNKTYVVFDSDEHLADYRLLFITKDFSKVISIIDDKIESIQELIKPDDDNLFDRSDPKKLKEFYNNKKNLIRFVEKYL